MGKNKKIKRLTESQRFILLGALLYSGCPVAPKATAKSLLDKGLLQYSSLGNLVLTTQGRKIAKVECKQVKL